jgi:thiamine-phosphate pyrophosphorylase
MLARFTTVFMALLLYYITDRKLFPGDAVDQEERLLAKIAECAAAGVDLVQLREKDLGSRALEGLAHKAMAALGESRTRLLINSRTDIALACGAHGVHLPANDLPASEVRAVMARVNPAVGARSKTEPMIGVSTHSLAEVASAEAHGADFAVFAPVFAKGDAVNREGLEQLRTICHRTEKAQPPMPVLALGGITLENARQCIEAGAAGIAAIRLFQQNNVAAIMRALREIG